MSLDRGTRVGSFEILGPLGAGGMGEVYRARDTKLDRDVAIKVLPDAVAGDPERLARFEREAKVLASLNHPHIAAIYGVEERALVMELVEGHTLHGRFPLAEALGYALQIAEALEAAHEKGIIHRDLKPANVMVTGAGVVKVLDFGLAGIAPHGMAASGDPNKSPTLTMRATQAGVIMGTASYMAPEQAAGKSVDRRADVWSFGVVLFEMLTGDRLFDGETVTHTLADVLRAEIDFGKLPGETPEAIRGLLRRCLDRDARNRLRDIGEARVVLAEYLAHPEKAMPRAPRTDAKPWLVAGAAGAIALASLGLVWFRTAKADAPTLRLSLLPPERGSFKSNSLLAISPDGRQVAFAASVDGQSALWVRDLDGLTARRLPGTEDASHPFWSPDSRSVAFFAGGKLRRIDAAGGGVSTLCDASEGRGGSWSVNDVILFARTQNGGLFRVSAAGGSPTQVTTLDQASAESSHRFPWFLPDGRHFLFVAGSTRQNKFTTFAADLDTAADPKNRRAVVTATSNAVYGPPGFLLYMEEQTLLAQPFDAAKMQTTGDAVPIAERVDLGGSNAQGQFSVSQNGTLVYGSGGTGSTAQLTWFDRSGKPAGTIGDPGVLQWPAISPDGESVAVDRQDPQTGDFDLWIHQVTRGTAIRFTFESKTNEFPVWSPDGSHIAFVSTRGGGADVYQKATGALSAPAELLDKPGRPTRPDDWSRDGRYLIEESSSAKTKNDIFVLPLFGDRKSYPLLETPFSETRAKLSPNGRWIAYASDETNRSEIYVQTFTGGPSGAGRKWQVSNAGGAAPVWSRDGRELFFLSPDQKMMAVDVREKGADFDPGIPKALFGARMAGGEASFDVAKDGRFVMPALVESGSTPSITVVTNWSAGLKKSSR